MDVVVLVGRIMFSLLFLGAGLTHLVQVKPTAAAAESKNIPFPLVAAYASGVVLIAGGLSVMLGVWADLGSLLLAAFLLVAAVAMHQFWKETDETAKQTQLIDFNKNIALAGASLMLFAFFAHVDELGLMLTCPLFHLR